MQAAAENKTRFRAETLFLAEESGRPVATVVVKGTFDIKNGTCTLAAEQAPVNVEGELWGKDPAVSSYRFEPELAFTKNATDVVVLGHAVAPRADTTEMMVGIRVGSVVQQQALVCGDRLWFRSMGMVSATKPARFEKIPLRWEHAFGGWDRAHTDPTKHVCDARNPVGVGARPSKIFAEGLRLPNIEDPRSRLTTFGHSVPPIGFGFTSPHWEPRASLAGTFDARWQSERAPLLPKNFDRRHLNAAAPGLVVPAYLRGDEPVVAVGLVPEGSLRFMLPGITAPEVRFGMKRGGDHLLATNLDTVIIDADHERLYLIWRCFLAVRSGPSDLRAIEVRRVSGAAESRAAD